MLVKSYPAAIKAADPATETPATAGEFEAIVSVFDVVDSWGDVVKPGAFADTLASWKDSGDPIPVWWSHRMDDPMFNIGLVKEAAELAGDSDQIPEWAPQAVKDHGGLWVKGQLDTGADASPIALQARRLMAERRVTQFSFAYDVNDGGFGQLDGDEVFELRKLKLYEIGPTPIGANEETELLGMKVGGSARKAGRVLSSKNEDSLRQARTLLDAVLAAVDDGAADDEPAKAKESTRTKVEEPSRSPSTVRLLCDLAEAEVASA